MRLVAASIRPHEEQGLELDLASLGTPTLVVGPNGAGKSRLLEALDVLLGPSLPERRLSTSLEAPERRRAAEQAASNLEAYFCFELDQVDMPGSWDSEFLGAHIFSPYNELQPLARDEAFALSIDHLETGLSTLPEVYGRDLPEPERADYRKLLNEVFRALHYVEVGLGQYDSRELSPPLSHWPALKEADLPREALEIAARLAPRRTTMDEVAHGIERFPFIELLLEHVDKGTLPVEPFNPGIPECADCEFPNIDLIRVGPESPALQPLLRQLSATVLDYEGFLHSDVVGGEDVAAVRAFGAARGLQAKLGQWEERLSRRLMESLPRFLPAEPLLSICLNLEPLGRSEFALSARLDPDPHMAYGAGHLKWVAYALAKTTADVRRSKTSTLSGDVTREDSKGTTKATRPLILLFDEPESHLHWQLQQEVAGWIANESVKPNRTIIVVTHSPVFMGMKSLGKSFVPMQAGRAVRDPKHLESLVYLAGADKTALHWLVRGYLLVEGSHEVQLFDACFGRLLREQDLFLQQLFGSFSARGVTNNLKDLGRPIVVILDRVSRALVEGEKKGSLSHEEKTARDILRRKSARVVHFEVHDVIQALPEDLLDDVMRRLFPRRASRPWTWGEVVARHESERARKGNFEGRHDFKFAFLKQVGLFDAGTGDRAKDRNVGTVGNIVRKAAGILRTAPPPPLLQDVFLRAVDAFDPWPDLKDMRPPSS